jgi:anaerobic glycerol-3-phosphate dehydrogenase
MNLTDIKEVQALQGCLRATFETNQGKEAMKVIEKIGNWNPTILDSSETNEIIGRDANRRLIGTIKTLLDFNPQQIVELAKRSHG